MKHYFLTILVSFYAQAADTTISGHVWLNPTCQSANDCELSAFRLEVKKSLSPEMASTFMSASFETTKPEFLKKFAILQYIKGCVFQTRADGSKQMMTRSFFAKMGQKFLHKDWQIDSGFDSDPVYMSNPFAGPDEIREFDIPRNANYLTTNPSLDLAAAAWGGLEKNLKTNALFVFDAPTASNYMKHFNTQITASLQFKTCIYSVEQIPKRIAAPGSELPHAIACHEWDHNHSYEQESGVFTHANKIHPFCL